MKKSIQILLSAILAIVASFGLAISPVNAQVLVDASLNSGELIVPATQNTNLPYLTNTSNNPITLKIQAEGKWSFGPGELYGKLVDANGNPEFPGAPNDMRFPNFNAATLVALKNDKPVAGGKDQTIELLPGETVSFINNDTPNRYSDNSGYQTIKFTVSRINAGKLVLLASQETNLPSLTNTFGKPVKVKIQAEGLWNFGVVQGPSTMVDANGNNNGVKYAVKFPSIKPAALVTLKDGKPVASGKEQTFELLPGETVSFINNDQPGIYKDNTGSQTINYSFEF